MDDGDINFQIVALDESEEEEDERSELKEEVGLHGGAPTPNIIALPVHFLGA